MGKLTDALRKLGTKLTGKPTIESNSVVKIINDIADDYEGSTGGGVVLVDELPEIGEENLLYKTPDGKIWSYTTTTETETICDLEVGESYKFKDKVTAGEIKSLVDLFDGDEIFFNEAQTESLTPSYNIIEQPAKYYVEYYKSIEDDEYYVTYTITSEDLPGDLIEPTLDGVTEIPLVTITQTFVDNLTNADYDLLDVAFLFEGGSHTEEVIVPTWTEVGGSGGSGDFYQHHIFIKYTSLSTMTYTLSTIITDNNPNDYTYNDFVDYVENNGQIAISGSFRERDEGIDTVVIFSALYYENGSLKIVTDDPYEKDLDNELASENFSTTTIPVNLSINGD